MLMLNEPRRTQMVLGTEITEGDWIEFIAHERLTEGQPTPVWLPVYRVFTLRSADQLNKEIGCVRFEPMSLNDFYTRSVNFRDSIEVQDFEQFESQSDNPQRRTGRDMPSS